MVEGRLNSLSCTKEAFDEAVGTYNFALKKSGYNHILKYGDKSNGPKKSKRNRRRRCIYYNPPYCQSVKNNIGKAFLKLIDKHFGIDHAYNRIFNRSTVKLSYSCMPNASSIIKAHNKKILALAYDSRPDTKTCSCKKNTICPLQGKCLTKNVVYEAQVSSSGRTMIYIGSTGNDFKSRFYNHKRSFNNRGSNETELSKYIWSLKDRNVDFDIKWKILRKVKGDNTSVRKVCSTCNWEKIEIALADKRTLLNARSELNNSCPHFRRLYFARLPGKKPD